ncbi:hypothetical protein BDV38DRAFT_276688 [Aspergillus pseudotamarii]|uniref:Zn(2)-C6 fungal-type domain-containing protein n=1 Tax=Aspergillus pseudotamarii TaxID=132259 RepID=A0A5N6TB55_ASPPS|nr:uncharacterized protein BDV38DRAFT_276688 [Aspergillus pseudotamarii]KAE8143604.1 hypothetical protein BDV38DRAFT_276688 [Aspergillus pseudotamarii]
MSGTLLDEKPRACTNCSRAKAKCARVDDGVDICQRCLKNNLTCFTSDSMSTKRRGKATHAVVLEKKLDDIMALLTRGRECTCSSERLTERPTDSSKGDTPTTMQASYQDQPLAASSNQSAGTGVYNGSIAIVPGFEVSFLEADQILQEYMTTMVPEFPFVPLSTRNSYSMLKHKPLLLKTILWVCRPPPPEISAVFESWFRQHVANETVVLMNKDLELVQAILVFLTWYQQPSFVVFSYAVSELGQLTMLLFRNDIYFYAATKDTTLVQLAICLIDDLRLTQLRSRENLAFESIVEDAAHMQNNLQPQPKQTKEDWRTLLGVYYIASTLCSLLGKRYRLEYMAHFDDCCKQLQRDQEYLTDSLVSLVGIRKIGMKVNDSFWEMIGNPNNQPSGGVYSIAVASIQNELDTFMNQLPANLKWNHLLRTHYASIRIRLFEPFKFGDKSGTLQLTHLRSRTIWDCLQSTHELYDAFRLVPVESFPSLTVISILHIALAIIKASRLLCVEDRAWDLNAARTMYNLPGILQQLSKVFEDASSGGSPRSKMIVHGLPIFSDYAEAYRGIERLYLDRLNANVVLSSLFLVNPMNASVEDNELDFWNQLT